MHISILTLFPEMFVGPLDHSIIKRAKEKGLVNIECVNIRDFALDAHKSVDDRPYGGGTGMLLRVDVVDKALQYVKNKLPLHTELTKSILLDPHGTTYTQRKANELSIIDHLILLCGHYEGVDERIRTLVDEQISVGDYVLSGGEIPAMTVIDSVVRLIPGTLRRTNATSQETFSLLVNKNKRTSRLLEYPQYTHPLIYNNLKVPDVLCSGNHKDIEQWKKSQALKQTKRLRPDLLKK